MPIFLPIIYTILYIQYFSSKYFISVIRRITLNGRRLPFFCATVTYTVSPCKGQYRTIRYYTNVL